jgi:hypothetical protein
VASIAAPGVLAVQIRERALDRKCRPRGTLRVVFVRERIAEQGENAVAELLGDMAPHLGDRRRSGIEVGADEVAPFLGVELRGNPRRTNKVAEHNRKVAPLAGGMGRARRRE